MNIYTYLIFLSLDLFLLFHFWHTLYFAVQNTDTYAIYFVCDWVTHIFCLEVLMFLTIPGKFSLACGRNIHYINLSHHLIAWRFWINCFKYLFSISLQYSSLFFLWWVKTWILFLLIFFGTFYFYLKVPLGTLNFIYLYLGIL